MLKNTLLQQREERDDLLSRACFIIKLETIRKLILSVAMVIGLIN